MSAWTEFETIRHQAAIAGRVTEADTGRPVSGAIVRLAEMPEGFTTRVDSLDTARGAGASLTETRTTGDGTFHFVDLPDGRYRVVVAESGDKDGRDVTVTSNRDGDIALAVADIEIARSDRQGARS